MTSRESRIKELRAATRAVPISALTDAELDALLAVMRPACVRETALPANVVHLKRCQRQPINVAQEVAAVPRGRWHVIVALREANGLRQTDLATAAGMSRQYLCDLEAGRKAPGASIINRLARALRVAPGVLTPAADQT